MWIILISFLQPYTAIFYRAVATKIPRQRPWNEKMIADGRGSKKLWVNINFLRNFVKEREKNLQSAIFRRRKTRRNGYGILHSGCVEEGLLYRGPRPRNARKCRANSRHGASSQARQARPEVEGRTKPRRRGAIPADGRRMTRDRRPNGPSFYRILARKAPTS